VQRFHFSRFIDQIGTKEVQAVLFAATSEMQKHISIPSKAKLLCSMGFSDRVVVTAPDNSFTEEIDSFKNIHAVQALCIPTSERLSVKSISFSSWPTNIFDYPVDPSGVMALVRETFEAPTGESLKGVVLFQYQEDSFLRAAFGQQISKESLAVPMIGGIVNDILSSKLEMEKKTTFDCGWAIFGSDKVKVSSIALDLQSPAENSDCKCIHPSIVSLFVKYFSRPIPVLVYEL